MKIDKNKTVVFSDFEINPCLIEAVTEMGFEKATPIQAAAIPYILDGRDIVGGARTGSGKTAAFGLPLLHMIDTTSRDVQALVLAPTRELVLQVEAAIKSYAVKMPVKTIPIYGGAPYRPQLRALANGVHVVVGTPGRIIDHLERGTLKIGKLKMLVLDEADEMLRMGFIDDVEKVLNATPDNRQVALFSATMPAAIRRVAARYLKKPAEVHVETGRLTVDHIEQRWMLVPNRNKVEALIRVLKSEPRGTTLVFARTRKGCAEVADSLAKRGVAADALHGDLNQQARERIIGRLRAKQLEVLIATDVAARGIDIDHITHVINLDFPHDTEAYVHRIGRTGRAGRKGIAIAFITPSERRGLSFLERKLKVSIKQVAVPSDAQIAKSQRDRLKASLSDALQWDGIESTHQWLSELIAEGEFTAEDLAVAAIAKLASVKRINLQGVTDDQPPSWSQNISQDRQRPKFRKERGSKGPKRNFDKINEVELALSVGRKAGIRPADVVGALANELGISGRDVGKVTILGSKTFVGVPAAVAELALANSARLVVRGKRIQLSLSKSRSDKTDGHRPKRRAHG